MRKDVYVGVTVDRTSADILAVLAEHEAEGNVSRLLRQLIREVASTRGLTQEDKANVAGCSPKAPANSHQKERST